MPSSSRQSGTCLSPESPSTVRMTSTIFSSGKVATKLIPAFLSPATILTACCLTSILGSTVGLNFQSKFEVCLASDTANPLVLSRKIRAIQQTSVPLDRKSASSIVVHVRDNHGESRKNQ